MTCNFFILLAVATGLTPTHFLPAQQTGDSFQDAVSFVNAHSKLILLSTDSDGAAVAVWPAMQGRILTSSAAGMDGHSFGWYNRDLIASGKAQPHMNAVGGEDRLWIGPEGGQFSIFFAPGVRFDLDHWYTPAPIDTEAFDIVHQSKTSVSFRKAFQVANYSGTKFDVQIDREVRLLTSEQSWGYIGIPPVAEIKVVGFESENRLTNLSPTSWNKSTGLLSLWVLGQFQATPTATIILPIHDGSKTELGNPVKTDYFGAVPQNRIEVKPKAVLFKADANYRSKLGLSPQRAMGRLGSYDPENHVLTIVEYTQPSHPAQYVNSAWEIQQEPFKGDVVNCYNDGPPTPGKPQLGRFYELESSSPAEVLASHASVEHTQRTIHLVGTEQQLDAIALATLGVRLEDLRQFNPW